MTVTPEPLKRVASETSHRCDFDGFNSALGEDLLPAEAGHMHTCEAWFLFLGTFQSSREITTFT